MTKLSEALTSVVGESTYHFARHDALNKAAVHAASVFVKEAGVAKVDQGEVRSDIVEWLIKQSAVAWKIE